MTSSYPGRRLESHQNFSISAAKLALALSEIRAFARTQCVNARYVFLHGARAHDARNI